MVHVLLPNEDSCAAVCVANLTSRPHTLAAGVEMGHANMAQAQGTMDRYGDAKTVTGTSQESDGSGSTQGLTQGCCVGRPEARDVIGCPCDSAGSVSDTSQTNDYFYLQSVFDSLPEDLSAKEQEEAVHFIGEHSKVFSKSEYDLRRMSDYSSY